MDWLEPLIEQYGINVVYLGVLLFIAQTLRAQAQNLPGVIALANKSMEGTKAQAKRIDVLETSNEERSVALLEYLRGNDTMVAQLLERVLTGQDMIVGTVGTMATTVKLTHDIVGKAAKQMTSENISDKLDRALALLEGIDKKLTSIDKEVETVKGEVAVVKQDLTAIQKKATGEIPAVASPSKTQAKRKTEMNLVVKTKEEPPPQETNDKPLTDTTH